VTDSEGVDRARAQRAAAYLASLRSATRRPRTLPRELAPRSEPEAYAVQRALLQVLGTDAGGWKIAMSSPERGASAPILREQVYAYPARLRPPSDNRLGIEPEVAFSLRHDLPAPPVGTRYQRTQLLEAIEAAYAVIEVVVSRYQSPEGAEPLDALADNLSNGGLVVSAPCRDWQQLDLRTLPVRLIREAADGSRLEHAANGGHSLGDPLAALLWLVNDRTRGDACLRAGDIVTTGSYAGLCYATTGSRVTAEFAGLGTASLLVE